MDELSVVQLLSPLRDLAPMMIGMAFAIGFFQVLGRVITAAGDRWRVAVARGAAEEGLGSVQVKLQGGRCCAQSGRGIRVGLVTESAGDVLCGRCALSEADRVVGNWEGRRGRLSRDEFQRRAIARRDLIRARRLRRKEIG